MPTLGFLKRRRTKEGHSDHSATAAPPAQQPSGGSRPGGGGEQTAAISGATGSASASASANATSATAAAAPPPPANNPSAPASSHQQQQPHSAPPPPPNSTTATTSSLSPHQGTADRNIANAPQNDGSALAHASETDNLNGSATSLGNLTPGGTASPGTEPAALPQIQQQQQQPATAASTMQAATQQRQPYGHQQQPSQGSVARVTKGKYNLTDFDILRTLGTGSFGRVHLVQSKHNQRFYAIKVLKKNQVVKMKQVEHTNDERRMLSDVKHPFLVTLWGTFQDWKNLYMVMDFVEGGELFSLLRKSGRFPNPVAKFYAAEVTLALEYLHSKNIIYRDLKPENLLLDRHGHLKITDFGFAKRVPDKTWTLCGTPDYLAPEVVSNKGYNKSVDWWSLGILIYEMLCGYTPFWDSGSPMRIYENILKGKIKYPSYIVPDAQDLLERLITADLTKRLGNLYGGSADVKSHPWFHEVTWDRLARKDIDAPYTPSVRAGTGDASQFDNYPEEQEKYGISGGNDEYGHLFTDF